MVEQGGAIPGQMERPSKRAKTSQGAAKIEEREFLDSISSHVAKLACRSHHLELWSGEGNLRGHLE